MPPHGNKVRKSYLYHKGQSQGNKVVDLSVIWKGIISGVCMPDMKSISLTVQKLSKVKVNNRQTDRTKTIVPNHLIRGNKNCRPFRRGAWITLELSFFVKFLNKLGRPPYGLLMKYGWQVVSDNCTKPIIQTCDHTKGYIGHKSVWSAHLTASCLL